MVELTTTDLVERVARTVHGTDPKANALWEDMPEPHRESYRYSALAILRKIADAGESRTFSYQDPSSSHDFRMGYLAGLEAVFSWLRAQTQEER